MLAAALLLATFHGSAANMGWQLSFNSTSSLVSLDFAGNTTSEAVLQGAYAGFRLLHHGYVKSTSLDVLDYGWTSGEDPIWGEFKLFNISQGASAIPGIHVERRICP